MSPIVPARPQPSALGSFVGEICKLTAFLRRDLLIALSYRVAFVMDFVNLAAQAIVFSFIGKLVDPSKLPAYGGSATTYLEFVAIGIVLNLVVSVLLDRVATAIRQEQMIGTLESLLCTPTATATVQVGCAIYEFLYIPLRAALFLAVIAIGFGLDLATSGIVPALVILLAFVPFVWGLGLVSAGAILTFRRGANATGLVAVVLGLASGAFFPVELLPAWFQPLADVNPIAIALDGIREALLGGSGWSGVGHAVALLVPLAVATLGVGIAAFRLALRRERRQGTLGLY